LILVANGLIIEEKGISVTIRDIARIAGVSESTVSRSLNNSPLISGATKERVNKIAREVRFEFNAGARSLSTSRTGTIGVIFPELYEDFQNSLFLTSLMKDVRHTLERYDLDTITTFPKNSYSGTSNIYKLLAQRKVDGLLVVHPDIDMEEWKHIQAREIPFVVLHYKQRHTDMDFMNYCYTDHRYGGYIAAKHLLQQGCSNILCVQLNRDELQFAERTEGFKDALKEWNISIDDDCFLTAECGFEAGIRLVEQNPHVIKKADGIFAHADILALGIIRGLSELGRNVPRDIGVVGYDDIELDSYFTPGLTTIHQKHEDLARKACEYLAETIAEGDCERDPLQLISKPHLVIRDSSHQ